MNTAHKDRKLIWRSPVTWLILAVISFMMAWLSWQMIDRYNSLQASLVNLPNPPTITDTLWVPIMMTVAKLCLLVVAYTTGMAVAKERSQNTLWYVLINQRGLVTVVWQKFKAQSVLLLFLYLYVAVVTCLLAVGGTVNWVQVASGSIGLGLMLLWFIALGLWLSSCCQNAGTAVLLNVVVFVMLWVLGSQGVVNEYGLNWLVLLSPAHHLRWFMGGEVGLSSMVYLLGGAWVFVYLTAQKLSDMRRSL